MLRNFRCCNTCITMILNEQIMSQLDQNFEELVRFTKIVAEEPELIQKIDQYMSEPNEANNAKISLFLIS